MGRLGVRPIGGSAKRPLHRRRCPRNPPVARALAPSRIYHFADPSTRRDDPHFIAVFRTSVSQFRTGSHPARSFCGISEAQCSRR